VARLLRDAGINTEVYLESAKLGNQLAYADRKGFRIAIIAGENEFGKNAVQVKHLSTKTARDVALNEIVPAVQALLKN
jgi:histidyl-tRNA synthetase